MAAEDDEYVESFVQGDDSVLMAAIQARDAACAPLLKCACRTLSAGWERLWPLTHSLSLARRPMGGNTAAALAKSLEDPPYATRTEAVKVRARSLPRIMAKAPLRA